MKTSHNLFVPILEYVHFPPKKIIKQNHSLNQRNRLPVVTILSKFRLIGIVGIPQLITSESYSLLSIRGSSGWENLVSFKKKKSPLIATNHRFILLISFFEFEVKRLYRKKGVPKICKNLDLFKSCDFIGYRDSRWNWSECFKTMTSLLVC
jgi:hypothetical protein